MSDIAAPRLSAREHHHLAKSLIDACGGVDEILRQKPGLPCRLERSRLYDFHGGRAFMPADVIACLEDYCGEPIYSRVLVERRPWRAEPADTREAGCDLAERAVRLQAEIREALADAVITPREASQLEAGLGQLEQLVARVRASLSARGAS